MDFSNNNTISSKEQSELYLLFNTDETKNFNKKIVNAATFLKKLHKSSRIFRTTLALWRISLLVFSYFSRDPGSVASNISFLVFILLFVVGVVTLLYIIVLTIIASIKKHIIPKSVLKRLLKDYYVPILLQYFWSDAEKTYTAETSYVDEEGQSMIKELREQGFMNEIKIDTIEFVLVGVAIIVLGFFNRFLMVVFVIYLLSFLLNRKKHYLALEDIVRILHVGYADIKSILGSQIRVYDARKKIYMDKYLIKTDYNKSVVDSEGYIKMFSKDTTSERKQQRNKIKYYFLLSLLVIFVLLSGVYSYINNIVIDPSIVFGILLVFMLLQYWIKRILLIREKEERLVVSLLTKFDDAYSMLTNYQQKANIFLNPLVKENLLSIYKKYNGACSFYFKGSSIYIIRDQMGQYDFFDYIGSTNYNLENTVISIYNDLKIMKDFSTLRISNPAEIL